MKKNQKHVYKKWLMKNKKTESKTNVYKINGLTKNQKNTITTLQKYFSIRLRGMNYRLLKASENSTYIIYFQ